LTDHGDAFLDFFIVELLEHFLFLLVDQVVDLAELGVLDKFDTLDTGHFGGVLLDDEFDLLEDVIVVFDQSVELDFHAFFDEQSDELGELIDYVVNAGLRARVRLMEFLAHGSEEGRTGEQVLGDCWEG
jgi:hypothetical protein